jgi:hypothetical protein
MTRTRTAARHSCDTPEWYTPRPFVEAARQVLGAIDLDPASHREANRIVRARRFYSDCGEARSWHGRVFCNPPGGLVFAFWHRMLYEWTIGHLTAAIWIGYSLEQLQTLQGHVLHAGYPIPNPLEFPICIPDRRIPFVENEARRLARLAAIDKENRARKRDGRPLLRRSEKAASPSHGNYVVYVGRARMRFAKVFSQFGQVRP